MTKITLGENIAAYRRKLGITQEELGKCVGVTTQAVSRWECGGTPDVELLPAIADRLHVSVDALFGRDGAEALDLSRLLTDEIARTPENQRMSAALNHIWAMQCQMSVCKYSDSMAFLKSLPITRRSANAASPASAEIAMTLPGGIAHYGLAEDMRYALLLARPENGFESALKDPDDYVRLFALLARPHYLDALLIPYTLRHGQPFTDRLAAARLQLPMDDMHRILEDLYDHNLLDRTEICDESSPLCTYTLHRHSTLITALFFCRQLMCSQGEPWMSISTDDQPLLPRRPGTDAILPRWNTQTIPENI